MCLVGSGRGLLRLPDIRADLLGEESDSGSFVFTLEVNMCFHLNSETSVGLSGFEQISQIKLCVHCFVSLR